MLCCLPPLPLQFAIGLAALGGLGVILFMSKTDSDAAEKFPKNVGLNGLLFYLVVRRGRAQKPCSA